MEEKKEETMQAKLDVIQEAKKEAIQVVKK